MSIKKRKITFNYITLESNDHTLSLQTELDRIINFIDTLQRIEQKVELNNTKFCLIEAINRNNNILNLTFKSAVHSYRAPLLDRHTVAERDNPKSLSEGETYKTHFLIKYINGEAVVLAENLRSGIAILQLTMYLNYFKLKYEDVNNVTLDYKFSYDIILKDNIDEELSNLTQVKSTDVYVDKQILGSEALNFSERLTTVQEQIIISVKATRSNSIKEVALDLLANFNGGNRSVKKIRIKGKNETNNDVTIDTSFIEKQEIIDAQVDPDTGEEMRGEGYLPGDFAEILANGELKPGSSSSVRLVPKETGDKRARFNINPMVMAGKVVRTWVLDRAPVERGGLEQLSRSSNNGAGDEQSSLMGTTGRTIGTKQIQYNVSDLADQSFIYDQGNAGDIRDGSFDCFLYFHSDVGHNSTQGCGNFNNQQNFITLTITTL